MNKIIVRCLVATSITLLILFLDIMYGQYTFSMSNQITKFLQNKFEYGKEQGIFEYFLLIFSTAGDAIVTNILGILIWFKASNKEQILKLYTMNAIASSVGNIVKMISAQPRPFYIDDGIKLDFCYTGYGDPSGHSLRPFVFYVLLLDTIIFKKFKFEEKYELVQNQNPQNQYQLTQLQNNVSCSIKFKELYPNSPITLKQCQIYLGIFVFLIGIGRLYFGVHFVNQIIMGWILGLYLLYLYYYCQLEQLIHKIYIEAKRIKDESACSQFTKYMKIGFMLLSIYLITFIICYLRHYSTQILEQKEDWKKYILRQDTCLHKGHYSYEKKFETSDVQYISIIFFPLYLFILYQDQNQNQQYCQFPIKMWLCKANIIKLTLYFILYMIQGKQRIITKMFEKGVPRLMITLIFEQVYYISYALFLLVIIPFCVDFTKTILFKLKKSRIAQIEEIESEP